MSNPLRPSCVLCALKHIGQARALLLEARQGYAPFWFYALGHLAESSDELVLDYEDVAGAVRAERKKLEADPRYMPDFDALVLLVSEATGYSVSEFLVGDGR